MGLRTYPPSAWRNLGVPVSNYRTWLDSVLRSDGATVANYQPGVGVTGSLNASAWANQIGIAGPLLQATGANQPIYLPFSGEKYAYLPAVAANTFTSPNQTVTGDQPFTFDVALNDYSPAGDVTLFSKLSGNDGFAIYWLTTDKVRIAIGDGASVTNVDMAAATTLTDATRHTIGIAWEDGVGATFSIDGVASAQVAAAKTLTNAAVALTIGSSTSLGKLYSLQVGSVYDFNAAYWPETSTNGTTQVSSTTGETWTLNNTGALLAQIVGSPKIITDGTASYMKTAAFPFVQPEVVIFVGKQITWTDGDFIWDGNANSLMTLYQTGGTPAIRLSAGAAVAGQTLTLNTKGIVAATYNGASSAYQVNAAAASTGNAGASNGGGFTLAARGDVAQIGNIEADEIILLNAVPSAAKLNQIISLLAAIHGISL